MTYKTVTCMIFPSFPPATDCLAPSKTILVVNYPGRGISAMRSRGKVGSRPRRSSLSSLPCLDSDSDKEELMLTLTKLIQLIDKTRPRFLRLGFNGVMRALERGVCEAVVVCAETPITMAEPLRQAALLRHIPVVFVPKVSEELSGLLSVRRVVALGTIRQQDPEADLDAVVAALDNMRDLVLRLAEKQRVAGS